MCIHLRSYIAMRMHASPHASTKGYRHAHRDKCTHTGIFACTHISPAGTSNACTCTHACGQRLTQMHTSVHRLARARIPAHGHAYMCMHTQMRPCAWCTHITHSHPPCVRKLPTYQQLTAIRQLLCNQLPSNNVYLVL